MAHDCYDDCIAYLDDQLGRLLGELERRGLLADTDVIITSDHGEAFGDHGILGHSFSVNVEEIGVPLVILSPDAPAGRVIFQPGQPARPARDGGGPAGARRPARRSPAARWRPTGIVRVRDGPRGDHHPRLLRAGQQHGVPAPARPRGRCSRLPRCPSCPRTHHYIRDGPGGEQLYDLASDPGERANLIASAGRKDLVAGLRRPPRDADREPRLRRGGAGLSEALQGRARGAGAGGDPGSDRVAETPPGIDREAVLVERILRADPGPGLLNPEWILNLEY